ncbi:MAG: transposase [Thermodesulfobacteriota bacterium]|nr:transposase [Thermodesulfobacteriota bacterium]
MKLEIIIPEVVSIFKEIQEQTKRVFEIIRVDIRDSIGEYQSKLMDMELTHFLGREPYEHSQRDVNHRNGSYDHNLTLKSIGEVKVEGPRDWKGEFETQVFPRSKHYENELQQDLRFIFLRGISTRTLSMISTRLIGRKISVDRGRKKIENP